jgi:hypothetical protein
MRQVMLPKPSDPGIICQARLQKGSPVAGRGDLDLLPRFASELWLNRLMFARKIQVEYEDNGKRLPCPIKWLDSFSMRNFTNASIFDDTMPVADGRMEIGTGVPLNKLREAMEEWFQRKGYLPRESKLLLEEK